MFRTAATEHDRGKIGSRFAAQIVRQFFRRARSIERRVSKRELLDLLSNRRRLSQAASANRRLLTMLAEGRWLLQ